MAKQFKPETLCVQAGWTPKKGEPRVLPIYQSTTFKYDTSEQMARLFDLEDSGYFYTRLQNPTNDAVAAKIAALEGGVAAMLTSSGQAANFYAIFNICQAGDHFVCSSAIYGGTFNLFGVTMKKLGIDVTFVNPDASEEEISAAFQPNQLPSFRMGSRHHRSFYYQVHGRTRHQRRRLYRRQRQLRLGCPCRQIPRTLYTGRILSWSDLYKSIRQRRLHHQSNRTTDA